MSAQETKGVKEIKRKRQLNKGKTYREKDKE